MGSTRKCKKNWILEYSEGFDAHTEAPRQYCIWAAISAIGAVLKNKIYHKHGSFKIFPNQYIILTGPPGIGKGESIHPVYNIVRELGLANVISDRITAPKILEKMAGGFPVAGSSIKIGTNGSLTVAKDTSTTLFSMELPILIGGSDWMLPFLCEMWDRGEYDYDTKNNGSVFVKGLCTSLIAGCVPDYIRKLNKDATASINGGFTARAIFVFADQKSKSISWPKEWVPDQALKDDLVTISNLQGKVTIDQNARYEFEKFYRNTVIEDNDSDVVAHFKRRYHVHVLKLAMIFSAAERDDLVVSDIHMINAITCLRHVLQNLDKAFRGVGDSNLAAVTGKIQDYIERKGMTTRSEILANNHRHCSPDDLDRVLSILKDIGVMEYTNIGNRYMIKHRKSSSKPTVSTSATSLNFNPVNGNGKVIP